MPVNSGAEKADNDRIESAIPTTLPTCCLVNSVIVDVIPTFEANINPTDKEINVISTAIGNLINKGTTQTAESS